MKNIFKSILAVTAMLASFASCTQEVKYASEVSADKASVVFDGVNPAETTVNVIADGDWYIIAPSWIEATPSHGTGNAAVVLKAEKNLDSYNELNAPRNVDVAVCGQTEFFAIKVSQNGASGLDATKHFKKITKAEEFDPAYPYLIVAEVDGSLLACMPCAAETDNSGSYAYMFPTGITAEEDGSVTMQNASLCFYFEAVEGGYAIRQNKGNYIWQSSSYANFYTCSGTDKASVWTVAFNADGNAILTNTSAGDRIFEYDAANYKDFGAWAGDLQSGYQYVALYKDSAEPNDEQVSATENTYALASATEASIAIKSNKKWTVRCHDSWVTEFTKSGEGDGAIVAKFAPNTGNEARTATFKVIGEYTNFDVTLTQAAPIKTISALNDWAKLAATSYEAELTDAVVSYVNGSNAFIEDASGAILLYKSGHGLVAGDKLNGTVSGTVTLYSGLPELTSMDITKAQKVAGAALPEQVVTIDELTANFDKYISERVVVKGVEITDAISGAASDRNGKIAVGDKTFALYAQNKTGIEMAAGSKGDLVAFPNINGTNKRLSIFENAQLTLTYAPGIITVSNVEVTVGNSVALKASVNSGAALSYVSDNTAVATVDATGKVTGVAEGTANITVSAPAAGVYSEASKTIVVTVAAPGPGSRKVVFTMASLPTSYADEAVRTENGFEYYAHQTANFGNGMQFKKNVAYIANKTPLENIVKIEIKKYSSKTLYTGNFKLYAGNTEKPSAGTQIAEVAVKDGDTLTALTFDLSGGNYNYFYLVNPSDYACYVGSIEITY